MRHEPEPLDPYLHAVEEAPAAGHTNILHAVNTDISGRLRPMTADDLDTVLAIERQSYSKPWTREQFKSELTNQVSYQSVLRVRGSAGPEVAGYIVFWIVYGEAHILNLTVKEGFRRRGLATLMMKSALALMEEYLVYHVFLEVRRSNRAARSLYGKLGFKESFERKNYYGDEDAIVMTLAL